MTEQEWLTATDPEAMLEFMRGKTSDRKLRLFAAAAFGRLLHLLPDPRQRRGIEVLEQVAEGGGLPMAAESFTPPAPIYPQESYVISLARRQDRREQVAQEFGREGVPHLVVDAVDGSKVPIPSTWKTGGGSYGCWKSHMAVLEKAMASGLECIAVYEDDAVLVEGYQDRVARLIDEVTALDPAWDCIFPGGQHLNPPHTTANPGIVKCVNVHRTHAYIVRGEYIRKLYTWWIRVNAPKLC